MKMYTFAIVVSVVAFLFGQSGANMSSETRMELKQVVNSQDYQNLDQELQGDKGAAMRKEMEKKWEKKIQSIVVGIEARMLVLDGRQGEAIELLKKAKNELPEDVDIQGMLSSMLYPAVHLETMKKFVSFDDGKPIQVDFKYFPEESRSDWLKSWALIVKDADGKIVRRIKGKTVPLRALDWDGQDENGKPVPDGKYSLIAVLFADYDCRVIAEPHEIEVTRTPPPVQISVREKNFTPGSSAISIVTGSDAKSRIDTWRLDIFDRAGNSVHSVEGKGDITNELKWDGLDQKSETVSDGDVYTMKLSGKLIGGTNFESNPDRIETSVKVTNDEQTMKFDLDSIEFESGSADIKKSSYQILTMVADLLKKYSWNTVLVRGHTDNVGSVQGNLVLSKKRAQAVSTYLNKKLGIKESSLSVEGVGSAEPVAANTTDKGRAKNRRVEFVLRKSEEKK